MERIPAAAFRKATRAKPRDVESPIHRAVLAHLRSRLPGAVITHATNEGNRGGKRGMLDGQRARSMGQLPGFPDLLVIWRGWVMGFEVKAPGGYATPAQKEVGAGIIDNGGYWAVVRSVDDADACLSDWIGSGNA